MTYQEYIDLGFKRTDLNDTVEFRNTGYYGFTLDKKINKKISISVCNDTLDTPKMYIKKLGSDTYHIISIKPEVVRALCTKEDAYVF